MKIIIKFIIKKKYRVAFFLKLWILWSMLYQWIECTFMSISDMEDRNPHEFGPIIGWEKFCKTQKLKHYGGDRWYMLWDVISHPLRFLYRTEGDCDDFALLGYRYFGDSILFEGDLYDKVGLSTINFEDTSSHAVFVWMNKDRTDLLVVSNKELTAIHGIEDLVCGDIAWISLIDVVEDGGVYSMKLDSVSNVDNYRKTWKMK